VDHHATRTGCRLPSAASTAHPSWRQPATTHVLPRTAHLGRAPHTTPPFYVFTACTPLPGSSTFGLGQAYIPRHAPACSYCCLHLPLPHPHGAYPHLCLFCHACGGRKATSHHHLPPLRRTPSLPAAWQRAAYTVWRFLLRHGRRRIPPRRTTQGTCE